MLFLTKSPTSKGSSLGDLMRKDPILVLRNFLQLVIQFCSSYMDIDLVACCRLTLAGSEA
jgi:hypothetical protein